jgi:hypothetical protein
MKQRHGRNFRPDEPLLRSALSQEAIMAGACTQLLSVLGLIFVLGAAPASAGDGSAGGQEVHALIERQLDAFARDDGASAYALAAPGLKTIFSDADVFMAMVRGQYAAVYRHRSVEFGPMEIDGDNVSQVLTIVDDNNQVWKALYKLTRQPDGKWLINGCLLVKSMDAAT